VQTQQGETASHHRFRALDGWRGVCALMVVLFHLNAGTHVHALTRNGWASVDFFFVLSGFVLMSAFETRVGGGLSLRRFSIRRLARLYPLHLFTLLSLVVIIGIISLSGGGPMFAAAHGLPALLQGLALVQGFTTNQLSWNFPSWSISIELWASLLFGLTLTLAGPRSWIVLCLYCLALFAVVAVFEEPPGPAIDEPGALVKVAHYLLAFFAGALLFRVYRWLSKHGWSPPVWAELVASLVVAIMFLTASAIPSPAMIGLFAIVILIFAFERGPVSRGLRSRPFQAMGGWSYSIYLVHPFWTIAIFNIVHAAGRWSGQAASVAGASGERLVLGGPFAMDLAAAVCLALVVATASLTYRFIERPGQRLFAGARTS
jgi:peptidoglycan/LPS O-acetylase OafA/YrhL